MPSRRKENDSDSDGKGRGEGSSDRATSKGSKVPREEYASSESGDEGEGRYVIRRNQATVSPNSATHYSAARQGEKRRQGHRSPPPSSSSAPKRARASDLNADDQQQFVQGQELARWEEKKPAEEPKPDASAALTRAGGAYIPPARLRMMQAELSDKSSEAYQRMVWERLKKTVHGQVNRVNKANIVEVVRTLLKENVLRGKGILARSVIQAQSFSPSFSHVFAALVAIINSKFPNIGELILRRLIIQFKRAFRRNDKTTCVIVSKFIAHLANQRVAHEIVVLEMLVLLMQNPTDDSIEVTVTLLKDCGAMLHKVGVGDSCG